LRKRAKPRIQPILIMSFQLNVCSSWKIPAIQKLGVRHRHP